MPTMTSPRPTLCRAARQRQPSSDSRDLGCSSFKVVNTDSADWFVGLDPRRRSGALILQGELTLNIRSRHFKAIHSAVWTARQRAWDVRVPGVRPLLWQNPERWMDHQTQDTRETAAPVPERDTRVVPKEPTLEHPGAIPNLKEQTSWAL